MFSNENNSTPRLGSDSSSKQGIEQNSSQQQTPKPEDGQNPESTGIQGKQFEPNDDNVPEEVKEETKKLGKGEADAYYKISEEEYEKIKKHVPENLQETITNSEINNGKAPQLWLPVINNIAFGLIAFLPGLNIVYAAVLYTNLKILPMWPKKKIENSTTHNIIENKPKKTENPSLPPKPDDDSKKQNFGSKSVENPAVPPESDDNKKQPFGSKSVENPAVPPESDDNKKQPFGSKSIENSGTNFGAADTNSAINPLTKVKLNRPRALSLPSTHVDDLIKNSTRHKSSFGTRFGTGNPL